MMTEIMRQTLASQARSVSYCKRRESATSQSVTGVNDVTRGRMPWHVLGTLSQTVPKFFLGVVSASTLIAVLVVLSAQAQTKSLIPVPRIQFLSTSGTLDTNLVVGTTAVTFTSTPTFNSATSVYFSITLTGNVTSSTLSNAIDGRVVYFNICQDATGDRTFTWPASVLNAPTIGSAASVCTSASFIYDGTNWREIAPSSRGSAVFGPLTVTTYVDLNEQAAAPADPAATVGRLYVLTADDILRIKRGATVAALVDDTNPQTIAGVKTFSSIPVLPASDPTASNEAARKAYVDSRQQIWRGGLYESAPTTGLTTIPLPVADQCTAGISVERVSVAAITKGTGTMTFQVTRYNSAGASQGNIFSGNQTYSNAGDNRQDYTATTTTATADDYFRFNIVTLNGQADVTFIVEGKCDVL